MFGLSLSVRGVLSLLVAFWVWDGFSVAARGQIILPPPVGGVYVDPSGVVRTREVQGKGGDKRPVGRGSAEGETLELPLVRLFEEAREEIESTNRLSEEIQQLRGMVEIRGLRIDPEANEIFLVGVKDEILRNRDGVAFGRDSGRPAMWIADLVVAFRTVGPGRAMQPFGCSIDMDPKGLGRAQEAAAQLIAKQNYNAGEIVQAMRRAIGSQTVRVFGAEASTPFAFACVEADVRLKRLALGLDASPVRKVRSHLSMSREHGGSYTRWWFVPDYGPIEVSEDGLEFGLSGPRLQLLASDSPTSITKPTASAQRFVRVFNANMDELCLAVVEFGRLRNLADMAVIAALVASDRLDARVGWDLAWVQNEFPVPEVPVPEEAEPLVNMVRRGSVVNVAAGGVQIDVGRVVRSRPER